MALLTDCDPAFDHRVFLRTLSTGPGVYRMLNRNREVIYVGKARNLKRRVGSYFQQRELNPKTAALVAQIRQIEVTLTQTEAEALLLESHLIKALQPRYNVLLRDDKSYPYLQLSDHAYPLLALHRGRRAPKGRYFGPYLNSAAVRESLLLLQKLFRIRSCDDTTFAHRSRPCLAYQIARCSAPCVGLISEAAYGEAIRHAQLFLEGRSGDILQEIGQQMATASQQLAFEQAAQLRDRIIQLQRLQQQQSVVSRGEMVSVDVIAASLRHGIAAIQLFRIRDGRNLGNRSYFPRCGSECRESTLIEAFITQYYLQEGAQGEQQPPPLLLVSSMPPERQLLQQVLTEQRGERVVILQPQRGERQRWLALAISNAEYALQQRLQSRGNLELRFETLQRCLAIATPLQRLECFDISHTQGEATVASCVVFDRDGARRRDYRRFNIDGITPGDDYAAMRQALLRRFQRLQRGEGIAPDLLLIDGGVGQLAEAETVLQQLQLPSIRIVAVAKGVERRPGLERLILSGQKVPIILPADSPALHLIQQVRDEAHRFAITSHRQRRTRSRRESTLESIAGLGPKRRQRLLQQFGGLREIACATVDDLCRVPGISRGLAHRIHDLFHPDES